MHPLKSFLVVWLLMFSAKSFCQKKNCSDTVSYAKPACFIVMNPIYNSSKILGFNNLGKAINPLPATHYRDGLGIICRKEIQLDKIMPVPVRFRLGSLEYVNFLENK